eukprot:1194762-Prorocentrum_minimum.AAC.1
MPFEKTSFKNLLLVKKTSKKEEEEPAASAVSAPQCPLGGRLTITPPQSVFHDRFASDEYDQPCYKSERK